MSSVPSLRALFECWFQDFPIITNQGSSLAAASLGSFIINLAFVLMALGLLWLIKKSNNGLWKFVNNNLTQLFVLVCMLGFVVYDVGMFTGDKESLLFNAPMAVLQAFGMFLLNSDVSAIHAEFHDNWIYMGFFSAAHFLAALVSLIFVIEHFGYNIIAGLNMFTEARFLKSKQETFIFWGVNDASFVLAKSIQANCPDAKGYRIIFVRTNNDSGTMSVRNGMERLFHFLSLKNEDFKRLKDLNCLTTNTFYNSSRLSPDINLAKPDILREELNLKWLARIISKKTTDKVHLFFLTDDDQANIQAVAALKRDATLIDFCADGNQIGHNREVNFYCHARDNSMNRVMEDHDLSSNIEVRIIDSAHLAIECLKRNPDYQPISMVTIDTDKNYGTVNSSFTSLVVGFGATGKDALRFLYEFGAFVDSNSKGEQVLRSPFYCHVIDKQMERIKGHFINAAPNVFTGKNNGDKKPFVELHHMDYDSDEFYNGLLADLAPSLNYVIIAIGDDKTGLTLAIRILKYMRRMGRDFNRLKIFVRSYEQSNLNIMKRIADHYNEGQERIIIFGDNQQIYSYSLIVEDEFKKRGEKYYDAYRALNPQNDNDGTWRQRQRKLRGLVTLDKAGIDPRTGCHIFNEINAEPKKPASLNSLQTLRRKEAQDKANALHEATKMAIIEKVVPNWYSSLVHKLFETSGNVSIVIRENNSKNNPKTTTYPKFNAKEQLLMDNLARLEHLRWNASHEVLGYTALDTKVVNGHCCHEDRMMHNCLLPWENLDKESDQTTWVDDYKVFDYGVVETTIDIYRRDIERKQQ